MSNTLLLLAVVLFCSPCFLHAQMKDVSHPVPNHNMVFIENKGQIRDQHGALREDIDVTLKDRGMNLFISSGQIHYQFRKNSNPVRRSMADVVVGAKPAERAISYEVYRLDMELLGANLNIHPEMNKIEAAPQHYYINGEAILNVKSYQHLIYRDVYPGIDWVIYLQQGKLKYDFVLQPGANPSQIRIRYKGATKAALTEAGSLQIQTPLGTLTEDAPVAWTARDKHKVLCNFKEKNGEWGFETAPYSGGLVLDPGLGWGTYFGGSSLEGASSSMYMCTEQEAPYNLYFTSETESIDRIATTGAYQTTLSGSTDAFLGKMSPDGNLLWATYFGGADYDISTSVSTDKFGSVYIAGSALSSGLATPGAHNTVKAGIAFNTYMARFDTSGKLKWATYYGQAGGDNEKAYVAATSDGAVYLCSATQDGKGISTPGAFKEHVVETWGVYSAFLAKFDSTGKRLWGTYYGGAGTPGPSGQDGYTLTEGGMAIDGQNNVFILGSATDGTNFDFPGAFQPRHAGGSYDCFLGKFNAEGKHQWGTYIGTSDEDRARTICTDREGNVFVGLTTLGSDNLATAGTSRPTTQGAGEFFGDFLLAKFSGEGKQLWGTYVGPEKGMASMGGLAVDACDNVYLGGATIGYTDITPSPDAHQSEFVQGSGAGFFFFNSYLMRYGSLDGQLQYSSFYGVGSTSAFALCADPIGTLYLAGMVDADSGIATPGAHQDKKYGEIDIFLTQFLGINIDPAFADTLVCVNGTFELPYNTAGTYPDDNEFSVELADPAGNFSYTNPVIIGTVKARHSGVITCTLPSSALAGEQYRIRLRASQPGVIASCWSTIRIRQNGDPAEISINKFELGTARTYASYQWYFNGEPIAGATDATYTVSENGNYSVVVTEANGCIDSSNVYEVNNVAIDGLSRNANNIHIYPNPTHDVLWIDAQVPYHLTLLDVTGRQLLQSKENRISLSHFAAGTYIVEVKNESGIVLLRQKIVKAGGH